MRGGRGERRVWGEEGGARAGREPKLTIEILNFNVEIYILTVKILESGCGERGGWGEKEVRGEWGYGGPELDNRSFEFERQKLDFDRQNPKNRMRGKRGGGRRKEQRRGPNLAIETLTLNVEI